MTAAPLPLVLVHGGARTAPGAGSRSAPTSTSRSWPSTCRPGRSAARRAAAPPEAATVGIGDFAASVLADLDGAGYGRVVLVGHSMGGLTVAEVARTAPERVAHVVYVSCIIPPEGGSVIDTLPAELQPMTRDAMAAAQAGGTPMGGLDEATIRRMFCNDMDDAQAQFVLAHCGAEAASVFGERVTRQGTPTGLPSTYVRLRRDQALSPADQEAQIASLRRSPGGPVDVVDLDTGHDVMISAPTRLAPVLEQVRHAAR